MAVLTVGGLKRKSYYGRTRAEVQAKLIAAAAGLSGGLVPQANERLTVGQFLTNWLSDTAQPSVRPSTFKGYEGKIRTHVLPALGTVRLVKLTPQNLEAFLNQKRATGLSPQTVQHLRAILRAALADAVKWGLLPRNVAALVDGPRVPHRDVQPLTPEEAQSLLEGVRTHRLGPLFSVALAVGLRQGEALGLRWNDIDLDGGTLTVRKTLQRVDGKFVLVEPKTVRSRRTIALPSVAISALQTHRARQMEERLMASSAVGGRLGPRLHHSYRAAAPGYKRHASLSTALGEGMVATPALPRPPSQLCLLAAGTGRASTRRDGDAWSQSDRPDYEHLQPRAATAAARSSRQDG